MRNSKKQREILSKLKFKHGYAHKEKLYSVWKSMKGRCFCKSDKAYKNYGGRGISVCEEWQNDYVAFRTWAYSNGYRNDGKFQEFTIDRIDVNGNYCPENCRIVPNSIQAKNKRNSIRENERNKICPICNKVFQISSRTAPNKTCSVKCGVELRLITQKELTKDKYKKSCPICNKVFEDRSGHFKDRIYCSNKCRNMSLSPIWEFNGEKLRVLEWSEKLGITAHCLLHRKNDMGWSIEKTLTTPLKNTKRNSHE